MRTWGCGQKLWSIARHGAHHDAVKSSRIGRRVRSACSRAGFHSVPHASSWAAAEAGEQIAKRVVSAPVMSKAVSGALVAGVLVAGAPRSPR